MKIGLVQINNSFSGQNYFPYSVGIIQAYIENNTAKSQYAFLLPIYSRIKISEAINQIIEL